MIDVRYIAPNPNQKSIEVKLKCGGAFLLNNKNHVMIAAIPMKKNSNRIKKDKETDLD